MGEEVEVQMARGVKAGAWNVNRRQCCALQPSNLLPSSLSARALLRPPPLSSHTQRQSWVDLEDVEEDDGDDSDEDE